MLPICHTISCNYYASRAKCLSLKEEGNSVSANFSHTFKCSDAMCLLITAAHAEYVYLCNYLFIFLRNTRLHIGIDTLVMNHNLNTCNVLNVCFVTVSLFCCAKPEQTNSQHLPRVVHEQSEEHSLQTLFIRQRSRHRINITTADCAATSTTSSVRLKRTWRNRSKPEPRTSHESFVICSTPVCVCV